ncbi:unnamed protein product [Calicophoron daubneyi]|uniref:CAP-Gly domain-containing protein n=1 Tax=Calicophoron daubneyi TaxID=300641 RepID=A0AAV2TXX1_CALDB
MAGAQQEPSSLLPVQDTCPNPDDDDASRSWIFKKLPGPWWWCEDCQGCVTSPAITIPHLFAILRQWTPYAQLQLFTIVEEIFRRGAHVDDRDGLTDMTLLHFAAKSGALGDEESACRVMRNMGRTRFKTPMQTEYLLDEGANLEARCKWTDMTPLHYAAYFDCPLLAELLIRRGADIRARSRLAENATPLHLAASQLSLGVARVLLQASALSLAGKDSLDARGLTPYGCLPPANQLPEPLCTLRDRLAELLGPPAGQQDGEQNEEQDIAAERKENSSETNSQASGPREDEASHSLEDGCVDRAMHSNLSVQPNGLSWLVAESGYLSPPMRHVAVTPPTGRPVTAPNVSRSVTINHPLPLTSCISARVTLQSLGLALNDRVCIGPGSTSLHKKPVAVNGRIGKLRYCGPVAFASGVWVGVELDEPLGRNNGTVNDVQYFSCAPNHGIFAPIGRIYKAVDEGRGQKWRPVQARPRPPTPHQQAQSPMENEAGSEMSGARRHLPVSRSSYSLSESFSPNQTESRPTPSPSHPPIDVSNVTAKVDTGLHSHSPDSNQYRHFRVGDRVLVAGQRRGVIRFIGQTQFAPGVWYGIELEQPVGKNNGSIGGVRYFECAVGHGIFAPLNRLQRLPNRPGTPQLGRSFIRNGSITSSHKDPGSRTNRPNARLAWSTTTSPMVGHAVIGRPALPAELLNALNAAGHTLKEPQEEPVFYLQEGLQVLCAGEIGIVRYIGPITFADGIWLGIELRKPRGRHDGSVAGKRYFTCRPGHGLLVRPSRVFCRGINAVKLLPPVLAAVERELAEKRHALQQNSSKTSAVDSVASDRRSSAISVDGPGMESHS